jgi:hypothetical protein
VECGRRLTLRVTAPAADHRGYIAGMTDQAPPPPPPPPPPAPTYGTSVQPGQLYVGKVRPTGLSILLFFVTFGIYGYVWWFLVHDEMKHSGQGIGGLVAIILAFIISPVAAFFTSDEVGKLYERSGRQAPVSAITGLWYFPGMFLVFLPIVWFVKTNGALNDYWRSHGAVG